MATKFKMISDEDVKMIRAARKALTRIAKKLRKLNTEAEAALHDEKKDRQSLVLELWRMLDEVDALDVSVLEDDMLSIRLLPSGREVEAIRL